MRKGKQPKQQETTKELEDKIIANSKDAVWAKKAIKELAKCYKREHLENVELIVPAKEVTDTYKYGETVTIKRTIRGFLFQCSNGFSTFVPLGTAPEQLLNDFAAIEKGKIKDLDKDVLDSIKGAICFVFQTPIFASLSGTATTLDLAANILRIYNEYAQERILNAKLKEETEQDIKDNVEFVNAATAVQQLVEADIPKNI